jgi:hypothetical protein
VYTVVPDACFKIERKWKVINWCTYDSNLPCINVPNPEPNATANSAANLPGPIVSPLGTPNPWAPTVVKIKAADATATNYSTFWNANANCYTYTQIIKIVDGEDPVVDACPTEAEVCDLTVNDGLFWNQNYFWDPKTESHDLCEAPANLTITATDSCTGAAVSFRYLLFLDVDQDGDMETVVSSTNLPAAATVNFGNGANQNFTGGSPYIFDNRAVPSNQLFRFALQQTIVGNSKTARVAWNTAQSPNTYADPQLPYGNHKIKWIVEDGCGNEKVCEYPIEVKDCKAPTVVCLNGLSVNIMPTGMITLWDTDFLKYKEDNCTPAPKIITGIRRAGSGTGFPRDAQGNPITNVNFTCADVGQQEVELWGEDLAGNADFCLTYVLVQDPNGVCTPGGPYSVAGHLKTEASAGVEEVDVELEGQSPQGQSFNYADISDDQGYFGFTKAVPQMSNFTVTPTKDDNPLNGVSTYDLVLISKHILGLEPLSSPYKMIAADANKSGSITTFDIVEVRKLILGIYTDLPNNTSWRFVDKSFAFPNMDNPFETSFPETKSAAGVNAHLMNNDFVGIKVGDVNGTAIPSALISADDRSNGELLIDVEDRSVKAGEVFTVNFKAAEKVLGYQFTLNLKNVEVVEMLPGTNMTEGNFGVFGDAITTSVNGDASEFGVTFRAKRGGRLSEMLSISSRITKAEAYSKGAERMGVALRYSTGQVAGVGFEVYQNQPNPWVNKTVIGFHIPEATDVTLTIFDETGRMLHQETGDYAAGYNAFMLDRALVNTTGVLYYKVETSTDSAVKSMIQTK